MAHLAVLLLSALTAAGAGASAPAPSTHADWVNPARDRIVLRTEPHAHAAARAFAHRGETLRVSAIARTSAGAWQRVSDPGRIGWVPRSDLRPAPAPRPPRRACASRAIGSYAAGRLACGRLLRAQGTGFRTWDFPLSQSPSRPGRRWGTSALIAHIELIARGWHRRHPLRARLLVGDLSRPAGGPFGVRFGGIGHAGHQNGLEADIYYPRADGAEREALRPYQVDRRGAAELVALIGATQPALMFVGCRIGLPARGRVRHLCVNHENHVHVRYEP